MARSWPGGDTRSSGRASHHEEWEARESLLLPCAATGVSLLAVWCLSGATPRGPPWTSAVTLPQGRNGLNARRMGMLSTCHEPSLCRHVHRTLWRSVWLDLTPRLSETACHQNNDVERYSRSTPVQQFAQYCLITRTDGARLLCFLPPSLRYLCYDSAPRAEPLWPEHMSRSTLPSHTTHRIFSWHESLCIHAAAYART